MRRQTVFAAFQLLAAMTTITLLTSCSAGGTSSIASDPASQQRGAPSLAGRMRFAAGPLALINIGMHTGHHFTSFYACPAIGPLVYVSDGTNNVINVYAGRFAGQAPCGQLASSLINFPYGLYVRPGGHDLYVANSGNILVFHRGKTTPYNSYVDPSIQVPNDVAVAQDGTVIASNLGQNFGPEKGSLSTWLGGLNGGTFVGNFPMKNDIQGGFLTVQANGKVYFDDQDATTNRGALWSVSCPAGACGSQTRDSGVSLGYPGGMGSDATEDVLVTDEGAITADTFELPNPNPVTFALAGVPVGMALNEFNNHWYVADALNNDAAEYAYPSGTLIGTVPGNVGGNMFGIAIDPGHAR